MNLKNLPNARRNSGYILLEVMLALMLYGTCVVALIRQLGLSSMNAMESQMDSRVMIRAESRLTEFHKMPNLAEYENRPPEVSDMDAMGIWTEAQVTKIENLKSAGQNGNAGQDLAQMYRISVRALYNVSWKSDPVTLEAEMWRYLPLYRPQGTAMNGGSANGQPQPSQ
jgi:Tfp pilus assembly protein PilV